MVSLRSPLFNFNDNVVPGCQDVVSEVAARMSSEVLHAKKLEHTAGSALSRWLFF